MPINVKYHAVCGLVYPCSFWTERHVNLFVNGTLRAQQMAESSHEKEEIRYSTIFQMCMFHQPR